MNVRRIARRGSLLGVLGLAALASPLLSGTADARISVCRSDPILFLSNSHKVQVSFSLPDTTAVINSVTWIHYAIHIPAGATVTSFNDPSDPFVGRQDWTVYADAAPNEYKTVAIVTTNAPAVSTTLTQQVVLQTKTGPGSSVTNSLNGCTNQNLTIDQPKAP